MSIFGLFSGKKPPLHAVIDVGSHSIKAIIFEASRDAKPLPRVLKKMVLRLPWGNQKMDAVLAPDERKDASLRIVTRLRELMFTMVREFERIPEQIIIALGPNLGRCELVELRVSGPKGEKAISRSKLIEIFNEAAGADRKEENRQITHLLSTSINGYPIRDPQDGEAEKIRLWGDISFRVLRLSLEGEEARILFQLRESLGGMPIEFLPLVASYGAGLTPLAAGKDFLAVDAGGEYTTLILLRQKKPEGIEIFPMGARHFIRGIAGVASISYEEAEDEKRRYIQGLLPSEKKKRIQEFLAEESKLWEEKFREALGSFYTLGPLPKDVFLFGGGAHLPEIQNILKKPEWISDLSYETAPRLKVIEAPSIFEGNSFGGAIRGPEEVGLASLMKYTISS